MISTYCHICGHNNGDLAPYNRLLRREAKQPLPNFDINKVKQAPPMLIDIYHLFETASKLAFVGSPNIGFSFDFWDVRHIVSPLKRIAKIARDEFHTYKPQGGVFQFKNPLAIRRDFVFGKTVLTSTNSILEEEYIEADLANADVPRISDPSKISNGLFHRGDDYRMVYKDFNEMRRFLIRLNDFYGYEASRHAVGNYIDKLNHEWEYDYRVQQFVGPYIEGREAGQVPSRELRGSIHWTNGVVTRRTFPSAFTAKIAGDNQPYNNQATAYPRTVAGDTSYYGSPRLVFAWSAYVVCSSWSESRYIFATTEIPLTRVTRSLYTPVWSFTFDLSAMYESTIFPLIKSKFADWKSDGEDADITIFFDGLYFDTGDITRLEYLCPDGWDYTPTA